MENDSTKKGRAAMVLIYTRNLSDSTTSRVSDAKSSSCSEF